MGDAALISGLINGLLSNLTPLIKDEFSLVWNFKKEVDKLSSTLSAIEAVLEDAERKRDKDKQTEVWLQKLKAVLYEVRDIVEEWSFEDLRLQVKRLNASSSTRKKVTNFITHLFSNTWTRLNIGHKIKDVREKIDQISSDRQKLHLSESIQMHKFNSSWRETMSLPSSSKVYGRDQEKKQIIDILLNNTSSVNELSVLPIVGIGGLGKTTLAQMIFNDDEISKHFDLKIWVCVSDEFDIKLVIKSILEEKAEACLEELQQRVRDKLRGKRYLIVLDDVWNDDEDAWAQMRSILNFGSNGSFVLTTTRKINVARIMQTITHFELSPLSDTDCWLLFEQRAFLPKSPKTPNLIDIGKEIAKKCKGVPLAAKTLGGQLGFTSDEKEWCRIRDTEILQNENSILSILRLSYYDLPYDLRRCFVFCAIFPKDTKIEKENLIQLWIAHSLIHTAKNQEVEDVGNTIWNQLCWRSFLQDEKEEIYWNGVYTTCKMHDFMHDLAQSVMKNECYTLNDNISCDDLGQNIRHLTIMVDQLNNRTICSLKKITGLQSLMLGAANVDKEILNVSKKLPSLRVLEVCPRDLQGVEISYKLSHYTIHVLDTIFELSRCGYNVQYEDLRYVGCLKYLRYLDISHSQMKTLPNSICDLLNLHTLKLNYCSKLTRLPKNTMNLISLRHLYLMHCDELNYMPRGMGQLKYLKTLSLFVIGNKEGDGQLDELKELDISGSLKIKNLGRVSDACIARGGISIAKKTSINVLELEWRSDEDDEVDNNESTRHEKIGEALEVSSARLKILKMNGYKGMNLPRWVGNASPSLRHLLLIGLDNVNTIIPSVGAFSNLCTLEISDCPKLGKLPPHLKALKEVKVSGDCSDELLDSIWNLNGTLTNLELSGLNNDMEHILTVNNLNTSGNEMNGVEVVTFPLLEELFIFDIMNLRGLMSSTIPSLRAFPNLRKLFIVDCTNLGPLPPHLKSLKNVIVDGECKNELLYSISNLSALTHLSLRWINERSVLFRAGKALMFDDDEIPSSSSSSQILGELGVRSTFQSLQSLHIEFCNKLRRLFDEEMMQGLTELNILDCPELMISVEEFGKLNINNSLQRLRIHNCPKLVSSEEAGEFMALLRSIRTRIGPNNFDVDIIKE